MDRYSQQSSASNITTGVYVGSTHVPAQQNTVIKSNENQKHILQKDILPYQMCYHSSQGCAYP